MKLDILPKIAFSLFAIGLFNTTLAQGEDCATATTITPGTYTGTTVGAVADVVPFCGTSDGTGGGVWYQITGSNNCGVFTASLCTGTAYDSKIRVYDGTCGALNCVGGSDDFCSVQSEVTWNYTPGTTYYILVHGSAAAEGAFSLDVTESSTDVLAPLPASSSIPGGVDQSDLVNNTYMAAFSQTDLAQSFIPTQNTICGAAIYTHAAGATGDLTITLYDNLPNAGGVVLATGVTPGAGSDMWVDVVWPATAVTPGITYYLVFTCSNLSMGIDGDVNNNYPGGMVYANSGYGSFPSFDYTFKTYYGCGQLSPVSSLCPLASLTIPTALDNCAGTLDGTPDVSFPINTSTTVTWTYDDGNGNITTETQDIIIGDVTAPVADAASLADSTYCISGSPTAPTATDDCAGVVNGTPDVTFPITTAGLTVVTWTYSDATGNTSTQTQNITINTVNIGVTETGPTLTADATGATYAWLDCNNAYAAIPGETGQSFSPSAVTGSYAVAVTEGSCTDTSACFVMDFSGISEADKSVSVSVYPNPASNYVNLQLNGLNGADVVIRITDVQGKVVYTKTLNTVNGLYTEKIDVSAFMQGVYVVDILSNETVLMSNRIVRL
ncbi:MAG: T9SS type A sorting domain-containing protein [Bacteroidetes bacterium]|nr:T9SS type A sorting domain-containing protein [Bacteroidota bacterium]